DTWIASIISHNYGLHVGNNKKGTNNQKHRLNHQQYRYLSHRMRMHFGMYAGYAQQYLYYYSRHIAGRKW
ncbi:MAG: hypothetical protein ACRD8Z_18560, partial [Nitrososphaeraceae archaeon]